MVDSLCDLSATEQARLIGRKQISPVELMQSTLERIGQIQPALNPFCFVFDDEALTAARRAEQAVMRGSPCGPLHGLPIAIKDFTPTRGRRTTRGSVAFENWVPDQDPAIVRRLLEAGAIMVGKTTTPEFAYASFTHSRLWGTTRNPWDPTRTPGGSSGGSGVAVTTGCAALAEGTDMGGSVRIPAALCGCVGLKPSLGRIPMDILPTVFDSISHFGPLARTVDDAALFLRVTEGPDEADIQSQTAPAALPARLVTDLSDLRIAHSADLGIYAVDPEVTANLEAVAAALRSAGAVVEPVELDWDIEYLTAWNEMWGVYLAAAFGHVVPAFSKRMDPAVVALIEAGQRLDAVSLKRIEYARTRQWQKLAALFGACDALLCPTMAVPAPCADAGEADFDRIDEAGYLHGLDMTSLFNNVAQCPALSVPSGMTASGLPTAAQIVGRRFDDPTVLRIGKAVERHRPWVSWAANESLAPRRPAR